MVMRMKIFRLSGFLILLLATLATSGSTLKSVSPESARDNAKRIRFQVVAIEESAAGRVTLSESIIEGPPGTDFNIKLQSSRFKMSARFLTDLISSTSLKVRTKLDTRRLHGYSENQLPLYEEDLQSHTLDLSFDEKIVLLPFGSGSGSELKIEIAPSMTDNLARLPSGVMRPLEINIIKQSPGGSINVEAFKRPHNFTVEAALIEDGREVATATANCLLEEAQEFALLPNESASSDVINNPLAVRFTVSEYRRSRPADYVAIKFDLSSLARDRSDSREPVAMNWSGISALESSLKYDLSNLYVNSSGKSYEIRFSVKLAAGEKAE
jgi:hypothetical protein